LKGSIAYRLLKASYYGEVFFSRLQGIAFDSPRWNGEYQLIRKLASVVRVAVDGGANRGDWTAQLLSAVPSIQSVLCVEPDEQNCRYLRTRFVDGRVSVLEAALGAVAGSARFVAGAGVGSGSGFVTSADVPAETVRVVTLDHLAQLAPAGRIDFVKLDIEGEEIEALHGARALFAEKRVGTVQVEYNSPWLRANRRMSDLFQFARQVQYTLVVLTPLGFALAPVYGEGLEDYRMRNLALVRSDHLELLRPFDAAGRFLIEAARVASSS